MIRPITTWFAFVCFGFTIAQYAVLVAYAALSGRLMRRNVSMVGVTLMTRHLQTFRSRCDMWRLLGWAVAANWGYRQLTLVWRIRSLFPGSTGWGEMPRAGFKVAAAATPGR